MKEFFDKDFFDQVGIVMTPNFSVKNVEEKRRLAMIGLKKKAEEYHRRIIGSSPLREAILKEIQEIRENDGNSELLDNFFFFFPETVDECCALFAGSEESDACVGDVVKKSAPVSVAQSIYELCDCLAEEVVLQNKRDCVL